jgi:hypothetical protein
VTGRCVDTAADANANTSIDIIANPYARARNNGPSMQTGGWRKPKALFYTDLFKVRSVRLGKLPTSILWDLEPGIHFGLPLQPP